LSCGRWWRLWFCFRVWVVISPVQPADGLLLGQPFADAVDIEGVGAAPLGEWAVALPALAVAYRLAVPVPVDTQAGVAVIVEGANEHPSASGPRRVADEQVDQVVLGVEAINRHALAGWSTRGNPHFRRRWCWW
jgi:hypothetical protein